MPAAASKTPRVAIVGGGLAGLAAAAALVERGCRVELFEARKKLGGRAGSYLDRATGETIDHCQHVAMGCCTSFLEFCRRTGIEDLFTRTRTLHFFGEDGRRSDFRPWRWLPAPLHLAGPHLGLKHLALRDKLSIGRAMLRLARTPPTDSASDPPVLAWLQQQGQSQAAIERFWKVVLVSALGESLDRASLAAARKVFVDGFLAGHDASDLVVPRVSLAELYDVRVADWLRRRGAAIHLETAVEAVLGDAAGVSGLRLAGGREHASDFVVLAVPWYRVADLLQPPLRSLVDPKNHFATIDAAPITAVHLWFDQPLTDLPHAILVGRLSQWVFARPPPPLPIGEGGERSELGEGFRFASDDLELNTLTRALSQREREYYYQIVISASHNLAGRDRQSIVDEVRSDLAAVFPAVKNARLLRWQLITEHAAVFSVRPGLDAIRPRQETPIKNLILAGDWTATGWPATMEGAVRSGDLAAQCVLGRVHERSEMHQPMT